jgi:alpha-glucuronidase
MTDFSEYHLPDEDGHELWLRYKLIDDATLLEAYRAAIQQIVLDANSPTLKVAQAELQRGLHGLLGKPVPPSTRLCGTVEQLPEVIFAAFQADIEAS